jgi:sugar lactone lactonase YvrE
MRRTLQIVGLLLLPVLGYLAFWPVPIEPVAWNAPAPAGYTGAHAPNDRLAGVTAISVAPEVGPEHIEFGPDGRLYAGVLSGAVLRMNPDGSDLETVVNTGGRPLGLAFDGAGRLIVADAFKGVLAVAGDGSIDVLIDQVDGTPIRYADAVVVAADGAIFVTDASQRLVPQVWGTFDAAVLDIMEHSCSGRVLRHEPASGRTEVVMGDLCFPNGVALSGDQRHVFIAETGEYRIWKVDVTGRGLSGRTTATDGTDPRARVIVANLPGFPDNLTRSADGRLWTGLTKPRSAAIDGMAARPWLRRLTLRLPKSLWPVPPAYGHIIAFDEDGGVLADLQDPDGRIPETSGATEYAGRIYVQSLHADSLGVIEVSAAGL